MEKPVRPFWKLYLIGIGRFISSMAVLFGTMAGLIRLSVTRPNLIHLAGEIVLALVVLLASLFCALVCTPKE